MDEPKVYTVTEFAKVMRISVGMAYKLIREGKVKCTSIGDRRLIPVKVVDEILNNADYINDTKRGKA